MRPDEFPNDEPFDVDADGFEYDDGFGSAEFMDDADFISASKRREKTRREAIRSRTPGVMRSASRLSQGDKRKARKEAIRRLQKLWMRRIEPQIRNNLPLLSRAILAVMTNAYFMTANALISEKMAGATSLSDLGKISVKSMIAAAFTEAAKRKGGMTQEEARRYAQQIYDGLSLAEKFIEIVAATSESGEYGYEQAEEEILELEDWFDQDAFEDEDWQDFEDEDDARVMRTAPQATPRQCARALRQAAKYLLRIERQLNASGRG